MKVYALVWNSGDGNEVWAIFSTAEKAAAKITDAEHMFVEEYEVDPIDAGVDGG